MIQENPFPTEYSFAVEFNWIEFCYSSSSHFSSSSRLHVKSDVYLSIKVFFLKKLGFVVYFFIK